MLSLSSTIPPKQSSSCTILSKLPWPLCHILSHTIFPMGALHWAFSLLEYFPVEVHSILPSFKKSLPLLQTSSSFSTVYFISLYFSLYCHCQKHIISFHPCYCLTRNPMRAGLLLVWLDTVSPGSKTAPGSQRLPRSYTT